MFIGGLNWETTDQSLKDYFSQFGEVVECTVMRDGATGRSRGFGFLTFKDPKTVNIVMVKEHTLDGKLIDPKRAIPRDEQERTSKIFVGGVSQEATESEFKNFFMAFGRVLDATLMMDKDTGRPRGFGFVTFDSEAAVDRTLQHPLEIHGKMIEVKKAQPRGNMQKEEEDRKFSKRERGFQTSNQGNFENQQSQQSQQSNNMTPAMMAQYWQRMQQYFQMMQQNMAAQMQQQQPTGNGGMGGMGGMAGMNPAMMQQMMAMQQQQAAQQQQGGGTPNPQSPTGGMGGMGQMNPQMMQQMMQQQQQGGGLQGMGNGMVSPLNGGPGQRPGFTAQEQLAFEQQKYERQQQRMTQGGYGGGGGAGGAGPGGPTSWEGMYDDVPQPNFPNQGSAGRGNVGGGRQNSPYGGGGGGGGRGNRGHGGNTPQPAMGNSQAPANAPTGPKNPGKGGASYRGGHNRGGHRGFHPYARGN
ncbi:MAG: hypothetical protein M1820_005507 [Bogoriella megaspora]|nr:MAG: hypothetical protein M1820_005507 [Bogoriella megaspora]